MLASRSKRAMRSSKGAVITEFAAALVLLLALFLSITFACYEVCLAFMIYNALNHSAHSAAMLLSRVYGGDPAVATSTAAQQAYLESIKYAGIVVDPSQFTVTFPPSPSTASWDSTSGNVPTVVVTCTYTGGQYGLPPFPNPDPLQLGQMFTLTAAATAYLE